jgi:hypothetical protein
MQVSRLPTTTATCFKLVVSFNVCPQPQALWLKVKKTNRRVLML